MTMPKFIQKYIWRDIYYDFCYSKFSNNLYTQIKVNISLLYPDFSVNNKDALKVVFLTNR